MPAPGQMETDKREVDTELRPTKESATLHPEETTETASQSVSALNGNEASQPALLAILTEEIKSLRSLFVEFSVEMADREVRYTRTVDTLSRKVVCLEDKVQELQKKLTKTLEIQSSKIGVLTTLVKSQTSPANSSPPASGSPGPSHPTPTTLESNCKQPPPQTANRLETRQPNDSAKEDLAGNETRSLLTETNNASTCASRDPKPKQHTPPSTRQESSTSSTTDLTAPAWKTLRGQARPPQTQTHSSISQTKKELTGSARLEKAVFFLGGISSDCQLDSVLNYCKERNVRVASCRFLPSRKSPSLLHTPSSGVWLLLLCRFVCSLCSLCNRRHCPFVALILLVSLPFLNAVALFLSDFSFLFLMTMSLTTCPVSVIGHLSTLPLHAHYAIHLPSAFHALAHPCFCPLLFTSLLLPTTLLLASELNFCLSLLPPSILLIYSGSSSLKLILNISIFQCDFCYWMKRI